MVSTLKLHLLQILGLFYIIYRKRDFNLARGDKVFLLLRLLFSLKLYYFIWNGLKDLKTTFIDFDADLDFLGNGFEINDPNFDYMDYSRFMNAKDCLKLNLSLNLIEPFYFDPESF